MMIQQLYGDNPLLAGWIISVQLLKDIEENIVVREQTNFVYATVQKGQICSSDRNCITTKIKMSKCAWRKLKKQPGILDSQSVDSVIPNLTIIFFIQLNAPSCKQRIEKYSSSY